ncbi:MAG: hypothetical protein ACT4P4_25750 [Betaproteobacteria bacterium]
MSSSTRATLLALAAIFAPIAAGLQAWSVDKLIAIESRLATLEALQGLHKRGAIVTTSRSCRPA